MSGAIGAGNPYLLTLFPGQAGGDQTSALLSAVYGQGASAPSGNPVQALASAAADETAGVAAKAAQPAVARATANFAAAVSKAASVSQLLANPDVLNVLLTANGLGGYIGQTALVAKALTSNLSDSSSLVNVLNNASLKTAAQTYDFAKSGLSIIQNPKVIATITQGYAEELWRQSLDATTPGLSEALTFRAKASGVTSVDQILGDATLRKVVTTALGVPEEIAFQDIGAQEQAISSRLDVSKFRDAAFVDRFAQQYLIQAGLAAASSATSSPDLSALAVQAAGLTV